MGGWRRYLELQAQAKTGLGSGLFIWALLAATFAILTAAFILLVAFIKVLGSAIQVSRAVGWRKLLPLLAVGVLAAGTGMEWFGRDRPQVESEQNGRRKLARAA